MKTKEWTNWSGSLRFTPGEVRSPRDDEDLVRLVRRAARDGKVVRVVGAGHSSSPLVETNEVLVSLEHLRGLESSDTKRHEAMVRAGSTLEETGEALFEAGLTMHNLGDVNVQTAAGAVSTGTHGSGKTLKNLATALIGGRMVTASGEIREISIESDRDLLLAGRCSLGAIGIFTSLRLQLLPAFKLRRREMCASVADTMEHLGELLDANRNFDFYWYPRSDEVKLRTLNPLDDPQPDAPYARTLHESSGWAHEIISKVRELKFEEMEYAMEAEAGPECFAEIRERMLKIHRASVAWRVLYRFVAPDDAYLSTAHGRFTVTISLHHNAGLPYDAFFNDIEPIFRAYGGRPHWGKKHSLRAAELGPLYPRWETYQRVRREMDPEGVFLNPYLKSLLSENGERHVASTR
jgi:FAD/FMN-containing dehydrogenase